MTDVLTCKSHVRERITHTQETSPPLDWNKSVSRRRLRFNPRRGLLVYSARKIVDYDTYLSMQVNTNQKVGNLVAAVSVFRRGIGMISHAVRSLTDSRQNRRKTRKYILISKRCERSLKHSVNCSLVISLDPHHMGTESRNSGKVQASTLFFLFRNSGRCIVTSADIRVRYGQTRAT